jgi:hypothetical protein
LVSISAFCFAVAACADNSVDHGNVVGLSGGEEGCFAVFDEHDVGKSSRGDGDGAVDVSDGLCQLGAGVGVQ